MGLDRSRLRVAHEVLGPQRRLKFAPAVRLEPQGRKEPSLEPADRMTGGHEVAMQLDRIDDRAIGMREQHARILALPEMRVFANA